VGETLRSTHGLFVLDPDIRKNPATKVAAVCKYRRNWRWFVGTRSCNSYKPIGSSSSSSRSFLAVIWAALPHGKHSKERKPPGDEPRRPKERSIISVRLSDTGNGQNIVADSGRNRTPIETFYFIDEPQPQGEKIWVSDVAHCFGCLGSPCLL
jgi:hypothetical protein